MLETVYESVNRQYKSHLSEMIQFVESLGICVNTKTKARGHQGFFMKNRIDISLLLDERRKEEVLVHEFAHYIHYKIEPEVIKSHGSLEKIFCTSDTKEIEKELLEITSFVDKNRLLNKLNEHRSSTILEIKKLDKIIKSKYPDFKRSYPFKPLDNPLKKTEAKYLLKYDRVKIKTPFLRQLKIYSVKTFHEDFPQYDEITGKYIQLKSRQRALKRIASRINRLNRYYKRPSELFARFIEALYVDKEFVKETAPYTFSIFIKLLEKDYYYDLGDFINLFFG